MNRSLTLLAARHLKAPRHVFVKCNKLHKMGNVLHDSRDVPGTGKNVIETSRRSLLAGLAAAIAAPAIIRRPGLLMPVKVVELGGDPIELVEKRASSFRHFYYISTPNSGSAWVERFMCDNGREAFRMGETLVYHLPPEKDPWK